MRRLLLASLAASAAALGLAACSSASSPAAGTSSNSSGATSSTTSTTSAASGSAPAGIEWSPAGTFGTEPSVVVPSGRPPTQLLVHDLIVGTGATAQAGDQVSVQYVGYSWTTKQKFDASWDHNPQLFTFQLGAGQVIPGWDQGVVGMRVGGRRELIIPPSLAYGSQSPSPAIASNDTLVFVIDLVKVG